MRFPWRQVSLYWIFLVSIRVNHLTCRGGYGFFFRSEKKIRTTQDLEYLFFLSRKVQNFFPEFNIRLYNKNSESDYFFFLHQNQNIFLGKKTYPPSPFKLNGRIYVDFHSNLHQFHTFTSFIPVIKLIPKKIVYVIVHMMGMIERHFVCWHYVQLSL